MKANKTKAVMNATLEWGGRGRMKGRVLFCNGVWVARVLDIDNWRWFPMLAGRMAVGREYRSELAARNAINRRFYLKAARDAE